MDFKAKVHTHLLERSINVIWHNAVHTTDFDTDDAKFADLIVKLLRDRTLGPPIAWMIKSWDEIAKSDAIRHEASQFCEKYVV